MSEKAMHLVSLDYMAIGIYLLLMAGIGLFFKWFVKDIDAYTKGSNTVPWAVAGISNFMAMFSTFVFVAYAGIAYEDGLVSVTVFWSTIPACIIAAMVFAKRWRRAGISTPIEYLETRFNSSVRQTIGWVGILMRILDNMVRLYAIGIFLTATTPLSLPMCLIVSSLIVISFTLFGGIWAVSMMGTVQFLILIVISVILFWLSLDYAGGMAAVASSLPDHLNWFNGPKGTFFWLFVYYIMIIIKYNENWIFIQRFYIVKDEKAAQKVGYLSAALFFIFPIVFMFPPIVTRMMMPELPDKEMAYVAISSTLLPPGLMGVMLASMFAATMSSLNSEYNVISAVLSKDVYQRLINSRATDKQMLIVAQISTVLVGLLVLFGALFIRDFGGAFEANKLFTGILAIPVGVPLVLGIINKRATPRGALFTVIGGALSGIVLNSFPEIFTWEQATLIETMICLLIFFGSMAFPFKKEKYRQQVIQLFLRLSEPIRNIPQIDPGFKKALNYLYAISLWITAFLFIAMGLLSVHLFSGKLSVAGGIMCLVLGLILWYNNKKGFSSNNKDHVEHKKRPQEEVY
jgi:SSS family transporter